MSMTKLSIEKSEEINKNRRSFLGIAAMTAAATQLGVSGPLDAQVSRVNTSAPSPRTPSKNKSFGPLKQIDAGVLNVGYAEAGPASGPAAILLHGWPYDIYSFVDVVPVLASASYRVIVPFLRICSLWRKQNGPILSRYWSVPAGSSAAGAERRATRNGRTTLIHRMNKRETVRAPRQKRSFGGSR